MLDELDDELEKAEGNLTYVTKKTQELIKKSGGKRNCILIVCLSVLVIILLFLIINA
jgi:syntaxin 6